MGRAEKDSDREVLVGGKDFDSSWIETISFKPMGSGATGTGSVRIDGTDYGYILKADSWQLFKAKALDPEKSTGAAYNEHIKHASINDAHGLGPVDVPNLEKELPEYTSEDSE